MILKSGWQICEKKSQAASRQAGRQASNTLLPQDMRDLFPQLAAIMVICKIYCTQRNYAYLQHGGVSGCNIAAISGALFFPTSYLAMLLRLPATHGHIYSRGWHPGSYVFAVYNSSPADVSYKQPLPMDSTYATY